MLQAKNRSILLKYLLFTNQIQTIFLKKVQIIVKQILFSLLKI